MGGRGRVGRPLWWSSSRVDALSAGLNEVEKIINVNFQFVLFVLTAFASPISIFTL